MTFSDFRLAVRLLIRTPAFAGVALVSLALGVGANAALFSLVDTLLMRPLPVRQPHELVFVHQTSSSGKRMPVNRETFDAIASMRDTFTGVTASASIFQPSVMIDGAPEPSRTVAQVTGGFFRVLGVGAAAGRLDVEPGSAAVVISDRFWQGRFSRDRGVVGRQIVVNDRGYVVAGVAASPFLGVSLDASVDVWILAPSPAFSPPSVIGRLQRGVEMTQAEAAVAALIARREAENPPGPAGPVRVDVLEAGRGTSGLREQYGRPLAALAVLVVLLLLITCSNIGTLLVVRTSRRRHELAIRAALGAGRRRLFGQLMAECLVLAAAGGVLAWLVARWSVAALLGTLPIDSVPAQLQFQGGLRGVLGVAALSVIGALAFGLLPAWRSTRVDATATLRGMPALATARDSRRLGAWLMAAQVALSVVLLTGAGLFLRTLQNMARVSLGFDAHQLIQVEFDRSVRLRPDAVPEMHRRLIERVSAVPGVRDVTFSNGTFPAWAAGIEAPSGYAGAPIGPRYFETMGIPLVRGRLFSEDDVERSYARPAGSSGPSGYAIVSESFARETFPGEDPIGKRAGYGDLEVIGMVRDAYVDNVRWKMPTVYRLSLGEGRLLAELIVRTSGPPAALVADVRRAVAEVAPRLVVAVRPVDDAIARSMARERLVALISGFFGLFGVVLAAIGLFGLAASSVVQRTNELGLRIALGASRRDVVRDALGGTLGALAIGLAVGAAAAAAVVRMSGSLVEGLLFGLDATDTTNLIVAVILLSIVAAAACLVPALRAIRISPLAAMRER